MKKLHGIIHAKDGTHHFARTVNYVCKMFMKSITGVKAIKLFIFVTHGLEE
jgi:hypothetical protein